MRIILKTKQPGLICMFWKWADIVLSEVYRNSPVELGTMYKDWLKIVFSIWSYFRELERIKCTSILWFLSSLAINKTLLFQLRYIYGGLYYVHYYYIYGITRYSTWEPQGIYLHSFLGFASNFPIFLMLEYTYVVSSKI